MSDSNRSGMDRRGFWAASRSPPVRPAFWAQQPVGQPHPTNNAPACAHGDDPAAEAPLAEVAGKTAYVTGASSGIGLGVHAPATTPHEGDHRLHR